MDLRMCVVALENGDVRYVEQAGRFVDDAGAFARTPDGGLEPIVSSDGDISFARAGRPIASLFAPAVFPPSRSTVSHGSTAAFVCVPIGAAIVAGATR